MTVGTTDLIPRTLAATLINDTCDDVLGETSGSDELVDLMNVVVNVFISRLASPEMTVREAIAENWDESVDEVLGWLP